MRVTTAASRAGPEELPSEDTIGGRTGAEIDQLQQVLTLPGEGGVSVKRTTKVTAPKATVPRRKISAAGHKRIAAATEGKVAKVRAGKK